METRQQITDHTPVRLFAQPRFVEFASQLSKDRFLNSSTSLHRFGVVTKLQRRLDAVQETELEAYAIPFESRLEADKQDISSARWIGFIT